MFAEGKEKRNGSRSGPCEKEGVAGGNGPLGWVAEDRRGTERRWVESLAMAAESGGWEMRLAEGREGAPSRQRVGKKSTVVGGTTGINGVGVGVKRSRPAIENGETRKREGADNNN